MTILSLRSANIVRIFLAAGALACTATAHGQAIISTYAGGGFVNNVSALASRLGNPQGVAVDSSGNIYIADTGHILKVDHSSGILTAVAGSGATGPSNQDGAALSVRIAPTDLAFNSSGNLLFLDGSRLRQLNIAAATISTIAGQGTTTGDGGPASSASLNMPQQFSLDSAGNIYIVEQAGFVRKIAAGSLVISTIAGNGGTTFGGDNGPATAATLVHPTGIAVDSSGNLYIGDTGDYRIRKIAASTQIITTFAGTGHTPTGGDGGSAAAATFSSVGELSIDSHGNLFVIDANRVRKIVLSTGIISTAAGNGTAGLSGDGGPATSAELNAPSSINVDSAGDLFIADSGNGRVRMVAVSNGVITTVAGTSKDGDGGLATGATLTNPTGLALDSAGDLFIASGNLIRKVANSTSVITTYAGGGTSTQDNIPAVQAQITPLSLAFDPAGNLVVGEAYLIRRIDTSGNITTIAGTGTLGFSGDGGSAKQAQIGLVTAIAIDSSSNIYFADAGNKRVRRIDGGTGVITTIAGNGGVNFSGFGQAPTSTAIGNVAGIAVDASGNVYVGNVNTSYLLKITPGGTLSSAGGNTGCSYIGDGGLATGASLCQPSSLAIDSSGNLFVGDSTCFCVRRIAGDTGIIQTVAGNGTSGYSGDGTVATQAELTSVTAVAVFGSTLYIADGTSAVVRAVTPDTPPALPGVPNYSALTSSASFLTGPIAPGELVSFFGNYLGPATAVFATLGSDGKVTNELGNVQVFFDGVPAPLIYVAAGQINAIAPYTVANGVQTVKIQTSGGSISSNDVSNTPTAPAIFPYAIVNQDGSLNDANHPVPAGGYVVMYGTGLGQTNPAGVDGAINPLSNFPTQLNAVSLTIRHNPFFGTPEPMNVFYNGPAPGLVSGVCQINVFIPADTASGENYFAIQAGPNSSPSIPIYVQ